MPGNCEEEATSRNRSGIESGSLFEVPRAFGRHRSSFDPIGSEAHLKPENSIPENSIKFNEELKSANALLIGNKFEAAEEAFRALLPDDKNGDAFAGLAVSLAKQTTSRKIVEAQKLVSKGKNEFANNPNMIAAAAFVSYTHSKSVSSPAKRDLYLEAAEKLAKRVLREGDSNWLAYLTLGLVYMSENDASGAIAPLQKLVKIQRNAENLVLLAEALQKVYPTSNEAEAMVDEALKADPSFAPARLQKCIFILNNGTIEDAERQLHLISKDQRGSMWNEVQGDIFKKKSDYRSAEEYWGLSNRLDPRNPGPYLKLVKYYSRNGDYANAAAKFNEAMETLPNDINLKVNLMQIAMKVKPELEMEFERSLELERALKQERLQQKLEKERLQLDPKSKLEQNIRIPEHSGPR